MPPLTLTTVLTEWSLPLGWAVVAVLLVTGYLLLRAKVQSWPLTHTLSFVAGVGVLVLAVGSGINSYSGELLVMHMAQHLLLITVVPALLVLGHPLELLRRTTTGRVRGVLRRAKRSPIVAVLTHPLFGLAAYGTVVVGTHLTPFLQSVLTVPGVHLVEELLYLGGGYLQLLPLLGNEPIPRRMAHFTRLVVLMLAMLVDTGVGVTLLLTTRMPWPGYAQPRPWGPEPLVDLDWAGAAMWLGGDTLMAVLALIVLASWMRAPSGSSDLGPWLEAARRSAVTGSPAMSSGEESEHDLDSDERALRDYNAMLRRLAAADRGGEPQRHDRPE